MLPTSSDSDIKPILDWLAGPHDQGCGVEMAGLNGQINRLRSVVLPAARRIELLDQLFARLESEICAFLPTLHDLNLPIARRTRQLIRNTQEVLESLVIDYQGTLPPPEPPPPASARPPTLTLLRMMQCLSWHLLSSALAAAPPALGLWQQLHAAWQQAQRFTGGADEAEHLTEMREIYLANLLLAIAQPASFTSRELEFIRSYIAGRTTNLPLGPHTPPQCEGIFWIDASRDFPAHALSRRVPPPDTPVTFFACDEIARMAGAHLGALEIGETAKQLGLSSFAETPAGQGVLRRLIDLWGNPARRQFPRRRQSHRAALVAGIDPLWQLLQPEASLPAHSEWMVINESPNGFAMMHMAGETSHLRVGDIAAIRLLDEHSQPRSPQWHICLVRWALSENPEHVEIGLQVMAPRALPVKLASSQGLGSGLAAALILPEMPPFRPYQALIVPTGTITDRAGKLVLLVDTEKIEIREVRTRDLDEQTACIEIFTVEPDERP